MDNTTLITGIILIFFGGLFTIPIGKLVFKKSLVFRVYAFAVVPLTICCMMAFIMDARGVIRCRRRVR